MDINFQYDAVKASDRLEILTAKRLQKLFDKYDFLIRAEVLFKTENTTSPEKGMICKIRLSLPGPLVFAESSHGTFEVSITETIDDLERQLRKRKDKLKHRA